MIKVFRYTNKLGWRISVFNWYWDIILAERVGVWHWNKEHSSAELRYTYRWLK